MTRQYGRPEKNIHALQINVSQRCYMDERTGKWHDERAQVTQSVLRGLMEAILHWTETKKHQS